MPVFLFLIKYKVKTGFNEQPNLVYDIPYILSKKDAKNSARNMLLHTGNAGVGCHEEI